MDQNIISIIIPIYNASMYLSECLDSILSQDFTDFELLLIDDGSTDNSGEICDEYAEKDTRIKVFHQKNQGVSVARNTGLDYAQGEYLMFVDADDILLPKGISKLYEHISSSGTDVSLASTQVFVGDIVRPYHMYPSKKTNDVINNMNHPALWGYLFRLSLINNNHIRFTPGLAYSEDQVFIATIAICAKSLVLIPDFVYVYRKTQTSACANKNGLITSFHQFWAASLIRELEKVVMDKHLKSYLTRKKKKLIKDACMDYATNSFHLSNYKQYEKQYLEFFENKRMLFFYTIVAWCTHQRRKIIRFKNNPLSENY